MKLNIILIDALMKILDDSEIHPKILKDYQKSDDLNRVQKAIIRAKYVTHERTWYDSAQCSCTNINKIFAWLVNVAISRVCWLIK